jgi:diguanylate cyclase (GGDEF)-like protein
MSEVSKRLEKADKYLQKGKQDAALEEYFQVLQQDPQNDTARQTAADLCIGLGRTDDARRLLNTSFDRYSSAGDIPLASAAFKKLARLGPPPVQLLLRYAQLVEKSNPREALDAYQGAAATFSSSADKTRALLALKHVVRLDPSVQNLSRQGTLAGEIGDRRTAAASFLQVAQMEEAAGKDASAWYRRAYEFGPEDPEVAIAYGRILLSQGEASAAAEVLAPLALQREPDLIVQELYGQALLADKRLTEAEPFLWAAFQNDPEQIGRIAELIQLLVESGEAAKAVELARKLEQHQRRAGNFREFVAMIRAASDRSTPSVVFLEYLCEVFNAANREHDYCDTLIRLFELYYAAGNFLKSATALDRAAEVDAYESGHERRLEMLRGKVELSMVNAVASRLAGVAKTEQQQKQDDAPEGFGGAESSILEDLMLQAEIFLQYSMRAKALERLERIHKLFPREEENTPRLRDLYLNAGYELRYDAPSAGPAVEAKPGSAASSGSVTSGSVTSVGPAAFSEAAAPSRRGENRVEDFARVTEITRNIYRQGNVKGVLFTAVNDVGRLWQSSRCVAALLTPGKPPSAMLEYCAPGIPQSDIVAMVKLVVGTQQAALSNGTVSISDMDQAREFDSMRAYVEALNVKSLLAVPLLDGEEPVGVILLEQCNDRREWRPTDSVVLKTIADQMLLAVNNAKLRSLVRTLAVTEERSGLLKRSSYLDVLLSEVKRAIQQQCACVVMLLHFGKAPVLLKDVGEAAVETMMEEFGQLITSHIRQTDVAVRYDTTKVALILTDTPEKNTFFVAEKLRKLMAAVHVPGRTSPFRMTVGIAESVMKPTWDPADIVTEVINRAETALESANAQGDGKEDRVVALAWQPEELASAG